MIGADGVGELYELLDSAGLLQRRTFQGLRDYIEKSFAEELEHYRRSMTAQIPQGGKGGDHAVL